MLAGPNGEFEPAPLAAGLGPPLKPARASRRAIMADFMLLSALTVASLISKAFELAAAVAAALSSSTSRWSNLFLASRSFFSGGHRGKGGGE